jgi:hypothetical protein
MKFSFTLSLVTAIAMCFPTFNSQAQSPGQIVRRSFASSVLNPNSDSYVSLPINTGFTTNDITQSEIAFKTIPLPFAEPVGDLATGQSGSFTDLITSPTDKSGLMAYYDGTNLIFRLRVGGISAGAKGYSILIDADNKAGNSGTQPDPNYVAPTAQGTGNIGFEWEVLLATGNSTTVTVYETDGKTGPNIVQAYQVTNGSNWQIAQALTTNSNNADYFYDFYVPLSAFTGTYAITGSHGELAHFGIDGQPLRYLWRERCELSQYARWLARSIEWYPAGNINEFKLGFRRWYLYQSPGDHQLFCNNWRQRFYFRYLDEKRQYHGCQCYHYHLPLFFIRYIVKYLYINKHLSGWGCYRFCMDDCWYYRCSRRLFYCKSKRYFLLFERVGVYAIKHYLCSLRINIGSNCAYPVELQGNMR